MSEEEKPKEPELIDKVFDMMWETYAADKKYLDERDKIQFRAGFEVAYKGQEFVYRHLIKKLEKQILEKAGLV